MLRNKRMANYVRPQKGITLIALVITIIVLLILAGITIAALTGDNGLITKAQKGASETDEKAREENKTLEEYEDYIDNYANGGNKYAGLKIGDYVDYEKYLTTTKSCTAYKSETGCTVDQTFTTQANTKWRVLDITNSGRIVLVSETPVNESNGINNGGLYLNGALGYNNGETLLNNICNTLYNSAITQEVRSMKYADITKVTGWDKVSLETKWRHWRYSSLEEFNTEYNETYNYTNKYKPEVNNGTTQTDVSETNTWDYFDITETRAGAHLPDLGFTIDSNVSKLIFGESINWNYWLASRSVFAYSDNAYYYVENVNSGAAGYDWNLFDVEGWSNQINHFVRPVVVLKSSVQIEKGADVNGVAGYNIK